MALSNMVKEPRREIIETIVGLGLFSLFVFADYWFAVWFSYVTSWIGSNGLQYDIPWPVGMLVGIIGLIIAIPIIVFIHFIGDEMCNGMRNLGYDPRPTKRY